MLPKWDINAWKAVVSLKRTLHHSKILFRKCELLSQMNSTHMLVLTPNSCVSLGQVTQTPQTFVFLPVKWVF